tara:strand:+ start:104 stop:544 length:441 start_codon:yes stop_codon:yes gene_type:complete
MQYRNRKSGAIVSENELKTSNPNTSFPRPLTAAAVNGFGYDVVLEGAQPLPSSVYESTVRDGIEEKDGIYYTKYKILTATGDAKTKIDTDKAAQQREERNKRLAETDYLALSDLTLAENMKTYRQALRDIPKASGWPHTHTWPTKP